MFGRLRIFCAAVATSLMLSACQPSHREMLNRADQNVLDQKAQLAKYLYVQVIREHKRRDDIRYRALSGLVDVSTSQLYDYPVAVATIEKIIEEYENEPVFRGEIPDWRWKLARIYRINLEQSRKALDILSPLINREDLSHSYYQEIARASISLGEYELAEVHLMRVWDAALAEKNCELARETQMDFIQNLVLQKKCEKAFEWMEKKIPGECKIDSFGLNIERINCLELTGDTAAAASQYEEIIKANPQNLRAQFLLNALKKREREKKLR